MKKIVIIISMLCSLVLTGCQKKIVTNSFMLSRDNETYALYTSVGDQLSEFIYKSYTKVSNKGYIVTNYQNQVAYIDNGGDIIIPFGEYETLSSTCEMLYGIKHVEEKKEDKNKDKKKDNKKKDKNKDKKKDKKEEKKPTKPVARANYVKSNLYILNLEGKVLYEASDKVDILKSDVPVVYDVETETYYTLHNSGEVIDEAADEILSTSLYDNGDGVILNYAEYSIFYDFSNEDVEAVTIEDPGNYEVYALDEMHDKSAALYDKNDQMLVYINLEEQTSDLYKDIEVESAYFDELNNLVIKNGETYRILTQEGLTVVNSFYKSSKTFVNRGENVYGPHTVYYEGEEKDELNDCQVYPKGMLVEGNMYPIYERGKGYIFYGFDGKRKLKGNFNSATPSDINGLAVVSEKEGEYLVDESGKFITQEPYSRIQHVGYTYYAVYDEIGRFGIIDQTGTLLLPQVYTTLPTTVFISRADSNYLLLNKNGRSILYDIKDEMKEVWSIEGRLEYYEEGYFQYENNYYTFEGDTI